MKKFAQLLILIFLLSNTAFAAISFDEASGLALEKASLKYDGKAALGVFSSEETEEINGEECHILPVFENYGGYNVTLYYYAVGRDSGKTYEYDFENDKYIKAEITVELNGENVKFEQTPVIKNGHTLVPLRAIFEALGAEVLWDEKTSTVISNKGDTIISLQIDNNIMIKNNQNIALEAAPEIINSKTFVPVRVVAESFGGDVSWDEENRTVIINIDQTDE